MFGSKLENGSESCDQNRFGECESERDELVERFYAKFPIEQWKVHGLFEDSFVSRISNHWLDTEPQSTSTHHLLAFIYTVVMVTGWIGNGLVLFLFLRSRSLQTASNYLIFNLSLSDFLMLSKMPVFIFNSYYEGPALGVVGCEIYGFVGGLTGTGSIMTLTMIAVDRSAAILHPLNPVWKTTKSRALKMIIFVWFYSLFFSGLPLVGLNSYIPEGYLTSCSFDYLSKDTQSRAFVFIFFLAAWFFPLVLISFSYISIFCAVLGARRNHFNSTSSVQGLRRTGKQRREIQVAIIGSALVFIWVGAWTPYAVVALLGITGHANLVTPLVSEVPALFCKTSSCINPFVYAINHPQFQRELRNISRNCDVFSWIPWRGIGGMSDRVRRLPRSNAQDLATDGFSLQTCTNTLTKFSNRATGLQSTALNKEPSKHSQFNPNSEIEDSNNYTRISHFIKETQV